MIQADSREPGVELRAGQCRGVGGGGLGLRV